MREIVSIYVGYAEIQLGQVSWKLFCLEYGVQLNGINNIGGTIKAEDDAKKRFFWKNLMDYQFKGQFIMIWNQQQLMRQKVGVFDTHFKSQQLISGQENSSNNFARGYYTIGNKTVDICLDRLRKLVENCDDLQGILIYLSIGGGIGSGSGSLLLEKLRVDYEKIQILDFTIFPSPQLSHAVVEPYNSIFATHSQLITLMYVRFGCNAIYDICTNKQDIERPSYSNLNRIIGYIYFSVNTSFKNWLIFQSFNGEISEFQIFGPPIKDYISYFVLIPLLQKLLKFIINSYQLWKQRFQLLKLII
ncbi:unnamed protein product [Paramecium octaurelia]|uniref:Tubulin/FtsZ GTPase domain-containing protein n=1 Tax=Paramecium octaurelia TaxID=43137 RepID=A0A8S1VVC4_PAROT|nr:unnamed protein product [Paramecium octaurelia]